MTQKHSIIKILHKCGWIPVTCISEKAKSERELNRFQSYLKQLDRVKVCVNYETCGNIRFDDKVMNYPTIPFHYTQKLSSTICDSCNLSILEKKVGWLKEW